MNIFRLVYRSVLFYWRTNVGVVLAAAVSTAILAGALVVGDSVRYTLVSSAEARLGKVELAVVGQDRFFRAALASDVGTNLGAEAAAVLEIRGLISNSDGSRRANNINVLGVDEQFYKVGGAENPLSVAADEKVVLNSALAEKLGVGAGEEVVLRIARPSAMPREIVLTPKTDMSIAFRLEVGAVADESAFGNFSLQANQISALNAFVGLGWLGDKIGQGGRANLLLAGADGGDKLTVEAANKAIGECWQLADSGLELRRLGASGGLELRSRRVFIEDVPAQAATGAGDGAIGVLTYFVNELRLGDKSTPYSMVSAIGKGAGGIIGADMRNDEIVINKWLADDLEAGAGDTIELRYFVVGPMRKLVEEKRAFRVRQVVAIEGMAADVNLMPEFPGLSQVANCRDWEPGIPIDLDKIRAKDEAYWDKYRGTPKAFVSLEAGQSMWQNRYGGLTAVRYRAESDAEGMANKILSAVNPASVGLFFEPVRSQSVKAGDEGTDFGQLFLGFSFFLIVAAVVLMGLLFVFGVESRTQQMGMLRAVGFSPRVVRCVLLLEGGVLAVVGAVTGTGAGLLYTRAMIYGLGTVWRVAVSGSEIVFHVRGSTLIVGMGAAVVISMIAIWLSVRRRFRWSVNELLAGHSEWQFFGLGAYGVPGQAGKRAEGRGGLLLAVVCFAGAVGLLVVMALSTSKAVAGYFFGAGALLLVGGLGLSQAVLTLVGAGMRRPADSVAGLSMRNATRRRGRSVTVVWLLACGVFLVIAVGANRHNPLAEADRRESGTGGFAFYAESAIPILHDLNSGEGRERLGFDSQKLGDVDFVQMKVHTGDDASCFNLNRAQRPRLLGVEPQHLKKRGAFLFAKTIEGGNIEDGWGLLERKWGEGVIAAVGDSATIIWALGKSVGDSIVYTDKNGRSFEVLLVGMLNNSILQGSLVVAESDFVERFADEGYRVFLIDAAEKERAEVSEELSRGLRDFGLEVTSARERLAAFSAVENTYLSIFQMLGGLGMILGSIGLGLVVLRNVLDRRGELSMLRAVGFERASLKRMVFYEHSGLMVAGLAIGTVAALVAVGPVLASPGAQIPYLSLALTVTAILVSGLGWIWLAATFALKGDLLDGLRDE